MIKNYIKIALRNIKKQKGYSFINIFGLAAGMACCIMILLWVFDELSFDGYQKNSNELYRVVEEQLYAGGQIFPVAVTPGPLAAELKNNFPEIKNAFRYTSAPRLLIRQGENIFYEPSIGMADPAIFEMLTFKFIKGDRENVFNNIFSIVLTETLSKKYFGNEDPVGKTLKIENQYDLTVTGVIENIPKNSHLRFDGVMPFEILQAVGRRLDIWGNNSYFTYIQLEKGVDMELVNGKIAGVIKKHLPQSVTTLYLQPITKIHLHSDFAADFGGHGDIKYVYIFSLIAFFVLIIACINFMNLTTARSSNRAKEVGMRKAAGAFKIDIIKQFLGESILLAFLSLVLAVLIVILLLPSFNNLSGKEMNLNFIINKSVFPGILGIAIFTGILSGSYPAFFLSAFKPANVIKGSLRKGAKSAFFRRTLVLIQFSLSVFLIIAAYVVQNQLDFISNKDLGYDKDQVIFMRNGANTARYYESFKTELLRNSNILAVTASDNLPTYIMNSTSGFNWEGKDPNDEILIHNTDVSYDFFETMKMEILEGRAFSKEFPTDMNEAYIINEECAKLLGESSAIGKRFARDNNNAKVIGVVKNFHFKSLTNKIEPMAISLFTPGAYSLFLIRISGNNISENLKFVENTWKHIAPDYPFEYTFLDEQFDRLYRAEQRMGKIFNYFTILGIFIACLGLLGLASFMAEQRTKEIGIRKVLGATIPNIVYLLSREFIILVAFANLIAWPLAYYFMNKWLGNYAYHAKIGVIIFVFSALVAVLIAVLTVSYQAVRAAKADPIKSLRYE